MRDESRHFSLYYRQAERRLARPGAARVVRYLLTGEEGRRAACRVDGQIRKLPGFGDVQLLEAFAERALAAA